MEGTTRSVSPGNMPDGGITGCRPGLEEYCKFGRHELITAVVDSSPLACIIFDEKLEMVTCNQTAANLVEVLDVREFIKRFDEVHPDFQPDGRSSLEKARDKLKEVLRSKAGLHFEWMHRTINGAPIPSEVTLKPVHLVGQDLVVAYIHDLRELKRAMDIVEKMQHMVYTDSLTGVYNRRYFMEASEGVLQKVRATKSGLSVVMIDIDNFKHINDTYGHPVGDEVLKILAKRIQRVLREDSAVMARYGGEEFVLMLTGEDSLHVESVAERVRQSINGVPFQVRDGVKIPVTISLGAATYGSGETMQQLVSNADVALYEAKARGKNIVVTYESFVSRRRGGEGKCENFQNLY